MMKITTIGAGAWGTALSNLLANRGYDVYIYDKNPIYEAINATHHNPLHFSEVELVHSLKFVPVLTDAIADADVVIFSLPSKFYRQMAKEVSSLLNKKVYIVSTAKGFDPLTFKRLSQVLREEIPQAKRYEIVSLLGPSYAEEVIRQKLTCISASSVSLEDASFIQKLFSGPEFRVYTNSDETGAEIAAALKNVIAIASGILLGLGEEENAKAALVTRGIAEIMRFGTAFGARPETFLGLSGIGDLSLTCNSLKSRNCSLGYAIGKADSAEKVLADNTMTVEGVYTSKYVHEIAKEKNIDMPITEAIYQVLFLNARPSDISNQLMLRALKSES